MNRPINLGPWSGGLNNVSSPHQLLGANSREGAGECVIAMNVDIDRNGFVTNRSSWTLIDDAPAHSGRVHGRSLYGVVDGFFGLLESSGFVSLFPVQSEISYTVLNGRLLISTGSDFYFVDGENYAPLLADTTSVDDGKLLSPMPAGKYVSYWNGRLVSAKGNSLFFSEPMWYGVYDAARGILTFEERIKWIAALETGIFVGLTNSVRFLAGSSPYDFAQKVVGGESWESAAAVIPTTHMSEQLVGNAVEVAIWLEKNGFILGLPDGSTRAPQGGRLQSLPIGKGFLSINGDRVTVLPR